MSVTLLHRRGSSAVRLANVLGAAELFFDTDLNALYIGDGTTSGGLPVGVSVLKLATKTTNYTVLVDDTGTHFDNIGASGTVIFTLPTAAAGLSFGFLVDAAHTVEVLALSGDHIAIGGTNSASGGNVQSNLPYAFIGVECHKATQWVATSTVGAWTVT